MALPQSTDSLPEILGDVVYTSAYIAAYEEVMSFAKPLDAAHLNLVNASTERNRAADEVIRKIAQREVAFRAVGAALVSFEKKADAHFDTDRKSYTAVFPVTPKMIIAANISDRAAKIEGTLDAASAESVPRELAPGARKLVTAWTRYQAALKALGVAEKAFEKASAKVEEAKAKVCIAMREAHGQLEAKYPDDRAFVESFFRKRTKKSAGKGEKKTVPVPTPSP